MRFRKTEIAEVKFCFAKKPKNVYEVNVDSIAVSKLVKTKANSKDLIGYLDKDLNHWF